MQLRASCSVLAALSTIFVLCACSTVVPEEPTTNAPSASAQQQTRAHKHARVAAADDEQIDPMVRSKPKKPALDNPKYRDRINKVSRSLRNLCVSPKNRAYFEKTPCLPAGMKNVYLKDDSYPTQEQRAVAAKLFKELDQLNDATRQIMLNSGNARHIENARYSEKYVQPRIHSLQERFLKGAMTWGQYNQERLAIFNDTADRNSAQ